jgi:ATP-dependent Clp protease protease subunit
MSRVNKPDVEQWLEHNIFRPTKTLLLNGDVDESMVELVVKGLTVLDATKHETPITILLSSGGGCVTSGLAIMNFIQQCTSEVHINVLGEAESMAAWILQAADVRRAYADASIMIHVGEYALPSNHPVNNKERIRQYEAQEDKMIQLLADKMDKPYLEVYDLIQFDKIYSAHEARSLGLIDEVIE